MDYLEHEIDEEIESLKLDSKKVEIDTKVQNLLTEIANEKRTNSTHTYKNPDFWKRIDEYCNFKDPILVIFEKKYKGWMFKNCGDLELLLHNTTGYIFWILDKSNIVFMNDHDYVIHVEISNPQEIEPLL